jgi:hypothetical protein
MMTVAVEVGRSPIHGSGVFAIYPISEGSIVWMFSPGLDRKIPVTQVQYGDPLETNFIQERGYQNPNRLESWVICVDEAQFLNFAPENEKANLRLGDEQDGENLLIAARNIAEGEELTVPPESDADYVRKVHQGVQA